jgi:hypothetical protein
MLLPKIVALLLFFGGILTNNLAAQGVTHIKEDRSVTQMRANRKEQREAPNYKIEGYWVFVQIFSNRKDAIQFQKDFNHRFNQQASCQIVYDEPNFKVYAGYYVLKAEAEHVLGKVKQAHATAKIIKMPLPPEFLNTLK